MRFSFDLDGVLWERPVLFVPLISALVAAGHVWGVIAGFEWTKEREAKIRKQLDDLDYPPPIFVCGRTGDYLAQNGAVFKSDMIAKLGICLHFDDYDYDHPDTIKLFAGLGQENRIARIRSIERREWSK